MVGGRESPIEKRQVVANNVTRPKRKVTLSFAHNTNSIGPVLHIHNGDSAAQTARQSDLPGKHLAWREALVCGPAPGNLSDEEFRDTRAKYLADAYGAEVEECDAELRHQDEALQRFSDHKEIVLWFEHDLFCQIHLLYLLNWFAKGELGGTKLSLICIGEFPGIADFRGLGQLNAEQLASLFPQRREVTAAQLDLGARAWAAYSSSDPTTIEAILRSDTTALSFLRTALHKHLARFPSRRNGLGRIENVALELIASGRHRFADLFPDVGKTDPVYGFGDAQVFIELERLAAASRPLLTMGNAATVSALNSRQLLESSFQVTELGEAVLRGDEDFVRLNGIDLWLGGVHLEGDEAAWRWDEAEDRLRKV